MPALWPYLLLLIPALPLVYDDFRLRQVAVVWLWVLAALVVVIGWNTAGLRPMLVSSAINSGILLLFAGTAALWALAKHKRVWSTLTLGFGSGDMAMTTALTPLFAPSDYVRFLLAASIAALVWWAVKRPKTLPFAGFMAGTLIVYAVCKTFGIWM